MVPDYVETGTFNSRQTRMDLQDIVGGITAVVEPTSVAAVSFGVKRVPQTNDGYPRDKQDTQEWAIVSLAKFVLFGKVIYSTWCWAAGDTPPLPAPRFLLPRVNW